ncbi:MAG: glycosyltransferase family 4 protein [Planctomycetota bacterium]
MIHKTRHILFLTKNQGDPSFRHRFASAIPNLQRDGWSCETVELATRQYIWRIGTLARKVKDADVVVLAKWVPMFGEIALLRKWCQRIVFDIDDAVYLTKPRQLGHTPGHSLQKWVRFIAVCQMCHVVVAGNKSLADVAGCFAKRVLVLPTCVDVSSYRFSPNCQKKGSTIVWIGLPENLCYLEPLRPVLSKLAERHPGLLLRIISSRFPSWDTPEIDGVKWTQETAADCLTTSDIGIMPLSDDGWTRGKCAFKLLQYMAAGLPCVASPVGMNTKVVVDSETGYLATTPEEWAQRLDLLLSCAKRRSAMGKRGREYAMGHYNVSRSISCLCSLFGELAS